MLFLRMIFTAIFLFTSLPLPQTLKLLSFKSTALLQSPIRNTAHANVLKPFLYPAGRAIGAGAELSGGSSRAHLKTVPVLQVLFPLKAANSGLQELLLCTSITGGH